MNERHEGKHLRRQEAKKRWKTILAVFLSVVLVMQSSNIQAFADVLASGGSEGRDEVVMDPAAEDTGTQGEVATPEETDTADEQASSQDDAEQTVAETEENPVETTSQDTEATTPDGQSDQAQSEQAPAEETDTTVTLNVEVSAATLKYSAQDGTEKSVTSETGPKFVDVSNTLDFTFTVAPDDGQLVSSVAYAGTELTANDSGEYTIAAADLTDGEKIVVTTEAVPTEEPAEDATPVEPEGATTETPAEDGTGTDETTAEDVADETANTTVEEEAVVADVSNPAYEGYAYVGDVVVKVTAGEGVLPEGTTVRAYQVNRQDVIDAVADVVESDGQTELKNSVAIDVTLIGPDGSVIQPEGAVNVCFFNTNLGGGEISVYRVADDASSVQKIGARQADAQVQSFDVDHFSIYVVGEEGVPALVTYNFVIDGKPVSAQIVKNGDTLSEPEVDSVEGKYFAGWYYDNGDRFTGFGEQQGISESSTVTLTGKYEDAYYVFFVNEEGTVVATKRGGEGAEVSTADVTFAVEANQSITGWYVEGDASEKDVGDVYTIGAGDVTLCPIIEEGAWLSFESNGGTYTAPQFYGGNQATSAPADPQRVGYDFAGWYSDESCTTEFEFGSSLSENTTIYAQWNGKTVNYTILYWVENADDDGYTYANSRDKTGTAGEPVELSNTVEGPWWGGGNDTGDTDEANLTGDFEEIAEHLTYNSEKTLSELSGVTIAGDGSTVVNVYFDRNEYTLTFQVSSGFRWRTVATITDKYGAYIADEFTKNPLGTTYKGAQWNDTGNTFSYALNTLDRMPGTDITFHREYNSTNVQKTIRYYLQTVDSNRTEGQGWPSNPDNDFNLQKTVYTYFNYATYNEEYHEIQGFTRYSRSDAGFDYSNRKNFENNRLDLYYLRNSYTLDFRSGDEVVKTDSVKYEAVLDSNFEYVPDDAARPATVPENATFAGWYTSPGCEDGTEVEAGTKMPAGNMVVYAKWEVPDVTVTIYDSIDGTNVLDTIDVSWDSAISEDELDEYQGKLPMGEGDTFHGWYTKDESGDLVPFSPSTQVQGDIELFPYYSNETAYHIGYYAGEGSGRTPTDSRGYAEGSHAKLMEPGDELSGPDGQPYFLGWEDEAGNIYQPGDYIPIEGETTVTAVWGAQPESTELTYNANYPNDATGVSGETTHSVGLANNASHVLITFDETGMPTPTNYEFAGWEYDGKTYQPGQEVIVDSSNSDNNVVAAKWSKRITLTFDANGGTFTEDSKTSYQLTEGATFDLRNAPVPVESFLMKFAGWNTQPDGEGLEYDADDIFTMPKDDITLYAQWTRYSVVQYDIGSGATWTDFGSDYRSQGTKYNIPDDNSQPGLTTESNDSYFVDKKGYVVGNNVTVAEGTTESDNPTRPGYTFLGWQRNGDSTLYKTGDTYNSGYPYNDDNLGNDTLTFHAQWQENKVEVTYVVDPTGSGELNNYGDEIGQATADGVTGSTATANPGYKFDGWYNGDTKVEIADADGSDGWTLTADE
ncbi:MAG TPA: InlB B-repeat-containing protein, partial [Candidatus Olsenella excrementigallinarum]|nr:InlB B-repeat-containing protein [Candidatus Olsenella excrementigallinarum]